MMSDYLNCDLSSIFIILLLYTILVFLKSKYNKYNTNCFRQ